MFNNKFVKLGFHDEKEQYHWKAIENLAKQDLKIININTRSNPLQQENEVLGIDLKYINCLSKFNEYGLENFNAYLEKKYQKGLFDVAFLTLSKCDNGNIKQFLDMLKLLLKDDGCAIIEMPNYRNYENLYSVIMGLKNENGLEAKAVVSCAIDELQKELKNKRLFIDNISVSYLPPHRVLNKMAELVDSFGGNASNFKNEASICNYYIRVINKVDFKDLYKKAYSLYEKRSYKEALKVYLKIVKGNENDKQGLLGLAKCFEKMAIYDQAVKCYKRLIELYPEPTIIVEYAHYQICNSNHREVLETLIPFANRADIDISDKDYVLLYKIIGNSFMYLQDPKNAEYYYFRALHMCEVDSKEKGVILVNLGTLEFQRDNMKKAKKFFNQALKCNSKFVKAKAWSGLGMLALSERKLVEAETCFYTSLDYDITCMSSIYNLVGLAFESDNIKKVALYLERYLNKKPHDVDIEFTLAAIYYEMKFHDKSLKTINSVLSKKPDHETAMDLKKKIKACNLEGLLKAELSADTDEQSLYKER